MSAVHEALTFLHEEIEKKEKIPTLSFGEYLALVKENPKTALRSIFQLFHDMVKGCVDEGADEYPDDPESIGFVKYDTSRLLVEGADTPFIADRLFANRFMRQAETLCQGFQQNRVYAYLGPSGCGKSTFLNNLLRSFEKYVNSKEGRIFEVIWKIDAGETGETLTIPCPSHDYPLLMIPKEQRVEFLKKLLGKEFDHFREKEYDWLSRGEVCTICKSIFWASYEKWGSLDKVLAFLKARPYKFDRRVGEGISIFNPGDKQVFGTAGGRQPSPYFTNREIQEQLDKLFGINTARYIYSHLAKTNNGIYVLMDVKMNNEDRLMELHNVISEGVHKVSDIEEQVNSLFFALMNPEDQELFKEKKLESLQGRIQYGNIPFVLEPATEVNIYLNAFGEGIKKHFLSHILENFAKVIVGSRMEPQSKTLKEWIPNLTSYRKYCDADGLLLRMEIYSGVIPDWLSEEDRKRFNSQRRRALIAEGEIFAKKDGGKVRGFSGRESLAYFNDFLNRYSKRVHLITVDNLRDFFTDVIPKDVRDDKLPPKGFLDSLIGSYEFTILNEVKESLYFYNSEQIEEDVLHYLWAVSKNPGSETECPFTGKKMEVTIDFLKLMATRITGQEKTDNAALQYANEIQKKYSVLLLGESHVRQTIRQSKLYTELFDDYARNIKEKVLQPFQNNQNFKDAIRFFGTKEFEAFDSRLKEHVSYMMKNLMEKFGYTEQGAKEICLYVIDKKLAEKFK